MNDTLRERAATVVRNGWFARSSAGSSSAASPATHATACRRFWKAGRTNESRHGSQGQARRAPVAL